MTNHSGRDFYSVRESGQLARWCGDIIQAGTVQLDTTRGELQIDGRVVYLRPREMDLFAYLMCFHDRIVTTDELLCAVWQDIPSRTIKRTGLVRMTVSGIRKKIEWDWHEPRLLLSFTRHGYRLMIAPSYMRAEGLYKKRSLKR